MKPAQIPCTICRKRLTWADCRRQYARLLERGRTVEEIKSILPRCSKCVTALLHNRSPIYDDSQPYRKVRVRAPRYRQPL
jgi:hypothetical protein